jgi:hypothetical protein
MGTAEQQCRVQEMELLQMISIGSDASIDDITDGGYMLHLLILISGRRKSEGRIFSSQTAGIGLVHFAL